MYKNLYRIICIAIFFGGCNNIVFGEPNLETEESHLPSLYINKDRSNGINLIGKTRRQSIYIKDGKNMYGNAPKSIMNYVNKRATNQSPALSRQINAVNKKLTQNNSATKSAPVVVPQLKLNPITKNKETKSVSEALKLNDNEKIYICDKYRVFLNVVLSIVAYQLGEYVDDDTTQKDKNSYGLTERELDVLSLMVDGLTNPQIADKLVITKATAKAHVHSILQKLCANSRTQATVMAMKEGLV